MKKFKKIFLLSLIVLANVILPITTTYAETIKETLYATHRQISTPSIFTGRFNAIETTTKKYVYCLQYDKNPPIPSITYQKGDLITDNGLNYLLNKAYSAKTDADYFIYKSAVWLYMIDEDIMEGTYNDLTRYYKTVKNSDTTEAKQILNLVENAKKAGANDTSAPTIKVDTSKSEFSLDSTKKYYVSNNIVVTSSTSSYQASLTNAPEGSTIEKNNNTLVIKVPVSSVTKLNTAISFKVSNTKDIYKSYKYTSNNSAYQPLAATYKETKTANATGNLTLERTVSIPVIKVDAQTGKTLSGANFTLTNSTGKVLKTWVSTEKEEVITGLTEGSYEIKETKAPEGYNAETETIKFTVDSEGKIKDINGNIISIIKITNEQKTGKVQISKQDITTKEELPGASLVIKDKDGNIVEEWVSTNEPHYIEKLPIGTYTLTETIAPEGYILSEETITFTVKDDGTIAKVVMYNTPKTGNALISKQDITTKEELPGASLVIKDKDGNIVEEWVSTNEPHYIEKLTPGTYTLTETIAPEGYTLSEEVITFVVKDDGSTTKVVMYNTPTPPEITVENTASFKTVTSSLIGTIVILIGSLIIIKNYKKKEI